MAAWLIVVGIAALMGFSGFMYLVFQPVFTTIFSTAQKLVNSASAGSDLAGQSLGVYELIFKYWPLIIILVLLVYGINKSLVESRRSM